MEWNGIEWNGMEWNGMNGTNESSRVESETSGVEWRMEWSRVIDGMNRVESNRVESSESNGIMESSGMEWNYHDESSRESNRVERERR